MLQQKQMNSAKNILQQQQATTYGLSRSSSAQNKDFTKGVLQRNSSARSSENNPFALKDRDMNKSSEKNSSIGQSAKKAANQKASIALKTKSPSRTNGINKHRASITQKSPTTNSVQSSGKKTPCISALARQVNSLVQHRKSVQKMVPYFEMHHDQIAEEENEHSSFLAAEREANKVGNDDCRSHVSQNLIGAHLIGEKDTYTYYPPNEAFQTPKPCRDEVQSSNQSPISRNKHSTRMELLQMSQQTTVVNQGARICYEQEYYASQRPQKISPIHSQAQLYQQQRAKQSSQMSRISSSQSNLNAAYQNKHISPSPKKKKNSQPDERYDVISGLALNVRKQTSPEQNSHSNYSPQNNIQMDNDGRLVLVANAATQIVENSYDINQGTRLIDDYSQNALSPQSCKRVLNPYICSNDDSSAHRFSSRNNTKGQSPAQIKLEPVRIVPTTGFDQQRRERDNYDRFDIYDNENGQSDEKRSHLECQRRKSTSPQKKQLSSASPSPCKQSPVPARMGGIMQAMQINTITEESPDTGNPLVATAIYENLKRMDLETISTHQSYPERQTKQTRAQDTDSVDELKLGATMKSASDVSAGLTTTEKKRDQRPKSGSDVIARRRRDQRKTPSGRNSNKTNGVNKSIMNNSKTLEDNKKQTKYARHSANNSIINGHKNEVSKSPIRQRSSSSLGRRSSNAPGTKRNSTVAQSCPISLQEQIRLANLQRAKQYGNRQSMKNKSGLTRPSSPTKKQGMDRSVTSTSNRSFSPSKPEILSACDFSVSLNIHPKEIAAPQEDKAAERSKNVRSSLSTKSHNSGTMQRRTKHEYKMSAPAQRAKAEFLQKHNCAKKIQSQFRDYRDRQQVQLEEEKKAQRKAHMVFIHSMASKLQRAYKVFKVRLGVKKAMQQRRRLKMIVNDLVIAWKTRRSLNCLGTEVQEFVNCEDVKQRHDLRANFHLLFSKVLKNKLYLEDNFEKLQKLRQQLIVKLQQAKTKRLHQPPASRARSRQAKQYQGPNDSPFKKQPSPVKNASPQKVGRRTKSSNQITTNQANTTTQRPNQKVIKKLDNNLLQPTNTRATRENNHNRATLAVNNLTKSNSNRKSLENQKQRNSSVSLGSGKNMDEQVSNVRNSFDNQAINELRNFIQNSDKKNESYCSIQFTSNHPNNHQANNERPKASNVRSSMQNENSQVLIQVHNKSLLDMISPKNQQSSDRNQINIQLGSCTRFSQKNFTSAVSIEEKPEIPSATVSKWTNCGDSRQQKSHKLQQDQSDSVGGNVCQYKENSNNLKKVRARVDCWNRSGSQGETTPNTRKNPIDSNHQTTSAADQKRAGNMAEKRNASASKTPNVQKNQIIYGSFNNMMINDTSSRNNKQSMTQSIRDSSKKVMTVDGRSKSGSHMTNAQHQQQKSSSQQSHPQMVRNKSMLREPTKFGTTAAQALGEKLTTAMAAQTSKGQKTIDMNKLSDLKQQRSPAIIQHARSTTPTIAGGTSRIEQLARPKSSQLTTKQQMSGTNLRSFVTSTTERAADTTPLKLKKALVKNSQHQQPLPNMQTQIFTMRETLLSLNAAMEQIASEADANQRLTLKDGQRVGGYGLNSQHRAAIKSIQAQEKIFNSLIATVQEQFIQFRDQAVPSHPSANQDLV